MDNPNIIVGLAQADDAGVYKLTDELALVQTVDFITPIVDDPVSFGMIAAANSLSDVYAMGAKPLTAMNIVCFPGDTMDIEIMSLYDNDLRIYFGITYLDNKINPEDN